MPRKDDPDFPHAGWEWITVEDHEGLDYPSCEYCERANLRYVHTLRHSETLMLLAVGCDCAEHLTGDLLRPDEHERKLRSKAAKRKRDAKRQAILLEKVVNARENFPDIRWERADGGALWTTLAGIRIGVIPEAGRYWLRIKGKAGTARYDTQREAQLHAFDVVQEMIARTLSQ